MTGEREVGIGGDGGEDGWPPLPPGAVPMVIGRRGDRTRELERISSGEVHGHGCPQSCGAKIESAKGRRRGGGLALGCPRRYAPLSHHPLLLRIFIAYAPPWGRTQ